MDRELIIRLAREVGLWEMLEGYSSEYGSLDAEEDCLPELQRFAALVAAHEREACAVICDTIQMNYMLSPDHQQGRSAIQWCSDSIRLGMVSGGS